MMELVKENGIWSEVERINNIAEYRLGVSILEPEDKSKMGFGSR